MYTGTPSLSFKGRRTSQLLDFVVEKFALKALLLIPLLHLLFVGNGSSQPGRHTHTQTHRHERERERERGRGRERGKGRATSQRMFLAAVAAAAAVPFPLAPALCSLRMQVRLARCKPASSLRVVGHEPFHQPLKR